MREILAEFRGIELVGLGDERRADWMEKAGFEDIGCDRKYETMVFRSKVSDGIGCCHWKADHGDGELDFSGYNDPGEAYEGHLAMCQKWSSQPIVLQEVDLS